MKIYSTMNNGIYSLFYKNKGRKGEQDYKQNTCDTEKAIFSESLRTVISYSMAL